MDWSQQSYDCLDFPTKRNAMQRLFDAEEIRSRISAMVLEIYGNRGTRNGYFRQCLQIATGNYKYIVFFK